MARENSKLGFKSGPLQKKNIALGNLEDSSILDHFSKKILDGDLEMAELLISGMINGFQIPIFRLLGLLATLSLPSLISSIKMVAGKPNS